MMFNKTFINTICITLMVTLLALTAGRVTYAYGMAAPSLAPSINPVYDTEIIDLKNYVESLAPGSREVFYVLAGLAVAAQGGSQNAKLVNPYSQPSDLTEWLSGCGVNLYNNVVGYTGTYNTQLGIDVGPILKAVTAQLMGDAVWSAQYQSLNDFTTDTSDIYLPFGKDVQQGIDFLFAADQGLYNWQFANSDWFNYQYAWVVPDASGILLDNYHSTVSSLSVPSPVYVFGANAYYLSGYVCNKPAMTYDFFINTSDHRVGFVDSSGNFDPSFYSDSVCVYNGSSVRQKSDMNFVAFSHSYNPSDFNSYQELALYYLNRCESFDTTSWFNSRAYSDYTNSWAAFFPVDVFSGQVYVGTSWATRQPIENLSNLNFEFDTVQYYEQLQGEYLLDIRNMMNELLNQTDLHPVVFNNIVDPYGDIVTEPLYRLVNVALNIEKYLDTLNPPLPVDLNDISELIDNSYLERVKEHARNFGDIFVNYIFFWHNCDADIVYTLFGAGIMVLIGAFIGKWGHS